MTMHLDRGLSTIRTSRPKNSKMTVREYYAKVEEHRQYNKRMKQSNNRHLMMTFEEYLDFRKPKTTKQAVAKASRDYLPAQPYRRDGAKATESIPSKGIGVGTGSKKESVKYTGDYVLGVVQTHKSNAVPVVNQQEIIDVRHMRR